MSMLKYWIWLSTRKGLRNKTALALIEQFDSVEEVYLAQEEAYREIEGIRKEEVQSLREKSLAQCLKILDECNRLDIWIMTYQDADYSARLKHIYDPPLVLYGKGRRLYLDEEPVIAIVGTRTCTPYGKKVATGLGYELSRLGMTVVSGVARGIDTEAMNGALKNGGPVVGVLGCGIDVVYPKENDQVYEAITQSGFLLSEYPPGTEPYKTNFPARNRIISGLSLGAVIVEGKERSGALITARLAMEQGRDVFAVPGNVDSSNSAGPNRLLRDGAIALLRPEHVVWEYIAQYPDKLELPLADDRRRGRQDPNEDGGERDGAPFEVDKSAQNDYIDLNDPENIYSQEERQVLLSLADGPLQIDDLIEKTQMTASCVLPAMTVLELQGAVKQLPGKVFRLNGILKET